MGVPVQSTRFIVLGCGGLGSPVVVALAAGGARRFVLVDDDTVDVTNLHRQIVFNLGDRGLSKAAVTATWIRARVPGAEIIASQTRISLADSLAEHLEQGPCVLIECSDDSNLKFEVQDFCVEHRQPAVIGGAVGWQGQAFGFVPGGACMRCWFEGPPPPELSPVCEIAGVMSTTTGVVGHAMAGLALALASGQMNTSLLHTWQGRSSSARVLSSPPRPSCRCQETKKSTV